MRGFPGNNFCIMRLLAAFGPAWVRHNMALCGPEDVPIMYGLKLEEDHTGDFLILHVHLSPAVCNRRYR